MKNKFILVFLLLPVMIGCQTTTIIQNSSSPTPSVVISDSSSVFGSINPTINVTSNPIISSTQSSHNVSEFVTPIIESNMRDITNNLILPKYNGSRDYKIFGYVYDINKNTIPNVNVCISNHIYTKPDPDFTYNFDSCVKSDNNGFYEIFTYPTAISININKEGYTKRSKIFIPYDGKNYNLDIGTLEVESINKVPEIQEITINNNLITRYYLSSKSINNIIKPNSIYKILDSTEIPRFVMISTEYLLISLMFNNPILKETIENNLFIKSLDGSLKYDIKSNGAKFIWLNNDKNVIFKVPINKQEKFIKYKLGFVNPFVDTNKNQAYTGEYIALQQLSNIDSVYTELSENIVFEIAGSK